MKNISHMGAALAALCALAAMPLHASTVLKIPVAGGKDVNVTGYHCFSDEYFSGSDQSPPSICQVSFPINLPVGTTIHQITMEVVSEGLDPNPSATGRVDYHGDGSAWIEANLFEVSTSAFPAYPQTVTIPLMPVGKNNPGSFSLQEFGSYSVTVDLQGVDVFVRGITVTYD